MERRAPDPEMVRKARRRRIVTAVVLLGAFASLSWCGRGNKTPFCDQHPEAAICLTTP